MYLTLVVVNVAASAFITIMVEPYTSPIAILISSAIVATCGVGISYLCCHMCISSIGKFEVQYQMIEGFAFQSQPPQPVTYSAPPV